ncbi:bifunctional diaminohydroxyphosphoribosylaminopyrimidine deaminase/5-amino-6-(5-phosphoribosylamino)uracil reductase RibD [Marinobacterium sp. D7]|uniref:bifunctional diaminohydroxyphosphoribosylaminopyrimidine deaminase/5-amino-6-(5-phosphoribosylamino)uracil reductase RibD n=1 Tax=Marinobacterium ramblicola TaxID=2849041 RepID=UPI001C2CF3EC|nr:bifunctional diaminohydroxyphosphoribosylaminopyrimidine deaminase/5-amino-6-(5-phosphoribosylamino)uracil reductase RibD [Marinobacterium ramblicola]MBV1787433.1 bifunctional diaminohydroxyphosphoribosylaminopyrimidine deaminase/5-amino-6-(5-phosphoribosylamino)uracil reductase RibD [Marinobacterium ramblicola]
MSAFSSLDHQFMGRAIVLARRGLYTTDPNPRVGCVLVRDGEIVGEGYHVRAGEGHAEVNALRMAGDNACGATAYVTLEPCSHFGRTPPCADTLIDAGIRRMVCAMVDPNPAVAGRGLEKLRAAGIEVASGLMEREARALNPGFIKRMERGLPLVRIKLASSVDGRTAMASGESQWITGPQARSDVQRLRARSSAIVTGIDSVLIDNSSLTVRVDELGLEQADEIVARQPLRVVLDTDLRLPVDAKILQQPGRTQVITRSRDENRIEALWSAGAEVISLPGEGRIDLQALLEHLASREQCNEVLVECGATLAGAFVGAGLVDELIQYMAPKLLGSQARPLLELPLERMAQQVPLALADIRHLGADLRLDWRVLATDGNQEH